MLLTRVSEKLVASVKMTPRYGLHGFWWAGPQHLTQGLMSDEVVIKLSSCSAACACLCACFVSNNFGVNVAEPRDV